MLNPIVVVNSPPVILLQKIGHLDLLQKLYCRIFIAQAVYKEILADEDINTSERELLLSNNWIEVVEIENIDAKKMFVTSLHVGEVETIILAIEKSADLCVFDDLLARKHAKRFDLNVTGTLGVLVAAKKKGFIRSVAPLLERLVSVGMYVSKELCNTTLLLAEEQLLDEQ